MTGVTKDSWCDLPADVLNIILEQLLYVEQIQFQSVCKNWRSNTNPLKHAADKLPWVMSLLFPSSNSLFYLYDPSQKRKYILDNEILIGAKVHASKHGWLLLSRINHGRMSSSFLLYTPFTHKIIRLPESHIMNDDSMGTFSTAPTSPDCLIFLLTVGCRKLYVSTCRLGNKIMKIWRTVSFDGDQYGKVDSLAFVGGVYYCLFSNNVMGSFKVDLEDWKIHPHPVPPTATYHKNEWIENCLIESHDGNLLVACWSLTSLQIFRYDQSEMKWFKVEKLGNRMLFLGVTSMLLPADEEASKLANTIHEAGHYGNSFNFGLCLCYFYEPPRGRFLGNKEKIRIYDWIDNEYLKKKIWIQPPQH
ncbi:hypothetical protein ACOSQ2_009010 [Xanthoceras sorbifolium]